MPKTCNICGAPLELEEFSEREICWNCFDRQFNDMIERSEDPQGKSLLKHLLNTLKETRVGK